MTIPVCPCAVILTASSPELSHEPASPTSAQMERYVDFICSQDRSLPQITHLSSDMQQMDRHVLFPFVPTACFSIRAAICASWLGTISCCFGIMHKFLWSAGVWPFHWPRCWIFAARAGSARQSIGRNRGHARWTCLSVRCCLSATQGCDGSPRARQTAY